MTKLTMTNMDRFNAAFDNYSWNKPADKGYATYSVYMGHPAIVATTYLDANDKRPLIMKANLSAIAATDAFISEYNSGLDTLLEQKKALTDSISTSSEEADANLSRNVQMIILADVIRCKAKLRTIEALQERNRLMAIRLLSMNHRYKQNVFSKYRQTAFYQ